MLTDKSMNQTLAKLSRLTGTLMNRLFIPVERLAAQGQFETTEPLHAIPDAARFGPAKERWGGAGVYGWLRYGFTVPEALDGKPLFFWPRTGFYEATLWVNGRIHSNYAAKFVEGSHGNHWCNRFTAAARAGETYDFALECYAYHTMPGTQPLSQEQFADFTYPVAPADICLREKKLRTVSGETMRVP